MSPAAVEFASAWRADAGGGGGGEDWVVAGAVVEAAVVAGAAVFPEPPQPASTRAIGTASSAIRRMPAWWPGAPERGLNASRARVSWRRGRGIFGAMVRRVALGLAAAGLVLAGGAAGRTAGPPVRPPHLR